MISKIFHKFPNKQSVLVIIIILTSCAGPATNEEWVEKALEHTTNQLKKAALLYSPEKIPRSCDLSGNMVYADLEDWTVGFFPGSLWYAYEITRDSFFLSQANRFTRGLGPVSEIKSTHDLGFMVFCSFGNGFRITGNPSFAEKIIEASDNLVSRFNPEVGAIRSWDWGNWEFPVIIDNMMNLEMLLWAYDYSGTELYREVAIQHANTTLKNHFRDDFSTYHVVDFDTIEGDVIIKQTHQGYSNESSWARGQAWALYAFTMIYKYTGDAAFLEHAKKIAAYLVTHERMPDDFIPYWDFDDPDIPDTYKDASSASIMACAFLSLSQSISGTHSKQYFKAAENILKSLCSEQYLTKTGGNGFFILQHSVGNLPANSEVIVSINYADYYFLEALKKYMEISNYAFPDAG